MKKRLFLIVIMIICIVLITACTKKYIATKLTQESQVPELVKEELQNVVLERGTYFFAETFTGEDAYLVFCAGEEYREGYDVEISKLEYSHLIETVDHPPKPIYGFYRIDYKEKIDISSFDYGIKSEYPLVIYRISGKIGEQAWPVLPPDSNLSINKWWGSDATQMENDKAKCEVTELTEEEVPIGILKLFNREPDLKVFAGGTKGNIVKIYYKIDSNEPIKIKIESLNWSRAVDNSSYPCNLVTHKESINDPAYEDYSNYFIVIKTTLLNERALPIKYLFIDDQLNWTISKYGCIRIYSK